MRKGDLLPEYTDVLKLDDTAVVIPDDCTLKFSFWNVDGTKSVSRAAATIVNQATGAVKYAWATGDTEEVGHYHGYWTLIYPDEREMSFPNSRGLSVIEFDVVPTITDTDGLSVFLDPIRTLLDDNQDTVIKQFSADAIKSAIRLTVNLGKVDDTEMSADGQSLDPAPEVGTKEWAQVILRSASRFAIHSSQSSSYRMRALAESFGERRHQIFELLQEIYDLENGEGSE